MAFTQTLQEDPSAGNYLSDEAIKRKRALADALIQQGSDTSAIRSPWQGVARLAQGLMGGIHSGMADAAEKENNDYNSGVINKVLGIPRLAPESGSGPTGDVAPGSASNTEMSPEIQSAIFTAADKHGIPRHVALAMARQESSNNPNAPHGGLFQITKGTAAQPGYGVQPVDYNSLRDPAANADFAMNYLSARNKGINWNDPNSVDRALLSYNGGGDPNYVQHVRSRMSQQNAAPVQVASNSPSQAFLLSREARKQEDQSAPAQIAQAQPSRAQQILAAMSDPRLSPQNRQILTQLYTDAVKNEERYAAPYMDDYGNLVQKDPSGKINVLHSAPEERDTRTPEQKNFEYINEHPEAKDFIAQNKQGGAKNHVVGGALVDDTGKVIYENKKPSVFDTTPGLEDFLGEQLAKGNIKVVQGYGRGAQGPETLQRLQASAFRYAQKNGLSATDVMNNVAKFAAMQSAAKDLSKMSGKQFAFSDKVNKAADYAEELSSKIPRGTMVPFNRIINAIRSNTSDPQYAQLQAAVNTLVNEYAAATGGSAAGTDAQREHAYEMLNAAQDHKAFQSVIKTIRRETEISHNSWKNALHQLYGEPEEEGANSATKAAPAQNNSGKTSNGLTWSVE